MLHFGGYHQHMPPHPVSAKSKQKRGQCLSIAPSASHGEIILFDVEQGAVPQNLGIVQQKHIIALADLHKLRDQLGIDIAQVNQHDLGVFPRSGHQRRNGAAELRDECL